MEGLEIVQCACIWDGQLNIQEVEYTHQVSLLIYLTALNRTDLHSAMCQQEVCFIFITYFLFSGQKNNDPLYAQHWKN